MNKKFIGLSVFTLATAFAYAQESDTLKITNLKEPKPPVGERAESG